MLCGSGLNSKNMIKALNTVCNACAFVYSFGVIHWSDTEMEELQRITRRVFTKYRHHHPKAAVERTMIARKDGGRGIIDVMELRDRQIYNMRKYFRMRMEENAFIQKIVRSDENLTPLNLHQIEDELMEAIAARGGDSMERWRSKAIHGRFFSELNSMDVDKKMSYEWVKTGDR